MNNYQSIATISGPEFINLQPLDINPLMSKCEIKVFYLGKNRNGTYFDKKVAIEMSKTLRGAPIVGYYRQDKGDFFDHGEQMIVDGDGVHFNALTRPYGFVSPDAKVWFQEFEEFDEAGRKILRTYLMTTGYLWTGQFKEAQQIFEEGGKPHSMELDEKSMNGFWSKEVNSECEFFIINDAIFSKLCILGDDVEPCFEGSSITAPDISKNFTLDDSFKQTLFSMMKELQYALQGGNHTVEENKIKKSVADSSEPVIEEVTPIAEPIEQSASEPVVEPIEENTTVDTDSSSVEENEGVPAVEGTTDGDDGSSSDSGEGASDYVKEEEKKDDTENSDKSEDKKAQEEDEEDKKEDKYALIVQELEELKANYSALEEENKKNLVTLAEYKERIEAVENKEKDALIAEFTMLSEDDKKEVIEHKAEYSLNEIKSKLAVICFDKKISYTSAQPKSEEGITVDVIVNETKPEWLQAVDNRKKEQ